MVILSVLCIKIVLDKAHAVFNVLQVVDGRVAIYGMLSGEAEHVGCVIEERHVERTVLVVRVLMDVLHSAHKALYSCIV